MSGTYIITTQLGGVYGLIVGIWEDNFLFTSGRQSKLIFYLSRGGEAQTINDEICPLIPLFLGIRIFAVNTGDQ